MVLEDIVVKCKEFLKNINDLKHDHKKLYNVYSNFFEKFRDINLFSEIDDNNEKYQLELCEAWNSILHCYKVVLENLSYTVISYSRSDPKKDSFVSFYNSNENCGINFENRYNKYSKINLQEIHEIIKELILICEKMKSYLESNSGITCGSSTSGLSIVLILVKYLTYIILSENTELIEKIQCSSLYCLSILFKIYKLEFTENWDVVLFPENIQGINSDLISQVDRFILPDFTRGKDVPFLVYFLFSSKSKVKINALFCIQSIFTAPILKYKNMITLLTNPIFDKFQDASAYSLLNNIIKLTTALLIFSEIYLRKNSRDIDTKITLIKTFSVIANNTPALFWKNHFLKSKKSFLQSLSSLLLLLLEDKKLIIPSLQLFSNILNLNKNFELEKKLMLDLFGNPFIKILHLNKAIFNINDTNENQNFYFKELSYNKVQNIIIESMNFFSKCIIFAPYLILDLEKDFSTNDNEKYIDSKFLIFLDILKFIIFNMNEFDEVIYIKGLKILFAFVNYLRNIWIKSYLTLNEQEHLIQDFYTESLKGCDSKKENINRNNDKIYSIVMGILISFINYIFNKNSQLFSKLIYNNKNSKNTSMDISCEILNIFSLVNPLIIEQIYCNQKSELSNSFVNLLLFSLNNNLEEKLLSYIIRNLLSYCGNSEWLRYSSFATFQHFELFLVQKLTSFMKNDSYIYTKESLTLTINKAIIFISMYHERNVNQVILCSKDNRRVFLNLLEMNYSKYIEKNGAELTEMCCLLNWRSITYSYKSFIQFQISNNKFIHNTCNISEMIRVLGYLSKLTPFIMDDKELLIWVINLLNKYIIKVSTTSLKFNKIKWNAIYAIGLLFQNFTFNNIIDEIDLFKNADSDNLLKPFIEIWNNLCIIIETETELTKVKLNALRSLSVYSLKNENKKYKIPHFLLLNTWKTFNAVFKAIDIYPTDSSNKNQSICLKRYDLFKKNYLFQLGSTLCRDTEYHLENSIHKFFYNEKEKILNYYELYKLNKDFSNIEINLD